MITEEKFYELLQHNTSKYPDLRYGQILFNSLYEVDPEYANSIRGGDFDPYYLESQDIKLSRIMIVIWEELFE